MSRSPQQSRSPCPIANTLDILGDRWTLLVVRDMMFRGFRHYRDFLQAGEGIATNILADRLERLVLAGIVTRRVDSGDRKRQIYQLTRRGIALAPLLTEVVLWGTEHIRGSAAPPGVLTRMKRDRTAYLAKLRRELEEELDDRGSA